jgi:quinohemoprotein ethanol dehydrogenase
VKDLKRLGAVIAVLALAGCGPGKQAADSGSAAGKVDLPRLAAADTEAGQWLANGRDIGKSFYSPLEGINRDNASKLGFAWEFQAGTARGMESTPLVVDGVMYVSGVAGRVYALDPASGKPRWKFEPAIDLKYSRSACCDIVNRGLSVWKGRVYVATVDGMLYSLDAGDGHVLWKSDTVIDRSRAYSVTGAPQVAGRVVVIGNGGAEYDSRGYVSAYDLDTGAMAWRFFTVPGDPSKPQESPALEKAVGTWSGGNWWERGGGGNVWDAITYDPETDLVYFGTANGAPTSLAKRSPGGGDNLYVASIIALHAGSGEYAWHYQQTPGERWDYDATPHIVLATLPFDGQPRKVLLQASKNGFFYVIDRRTGELLKADPFVATTWAKSVDLKTGRPVEEKSASYEKSPRLIFPSTIGAHNFNPMSLSARTGLVYIPTVHAGMVLAESPPLGPRLPGRFETGLQMALSAQLAAPQSLPPAMRAAAEPAALKGQPDIAMHASLKAWDPVAGKVVWEAARMPFGDHGGVLSTGGGLVIQGGLDGRLRVFNDETGALLKEVDVGTAMIAAPMTYRVGDVQYIAITAGSGGGGWYMWSRDNVAYTRGNANRVLAFRLDGGATPIPPELPPITPIPPPPETIGTSADIKAGGALFATNCGHCHANAPRAPLPDLRRSPLLRDEAAFLSVVRGGALQERGMPRWDDLLTEEQVHLIRAWLISIAKQGYEDERHGAAEASGKGLVNGHP